MGARHVGIKLKLPRSSLEIRFSAGVALALATIAAARAGEPRSYEILETPRSREISRLHSEVVSLQNQQARPSRESAASPATNGSSTTSPSTAQSAAPSAADRAVGSVDPADAKSSGYGAAVSSALPSYGSMLSEILPDSVRKLITEPFRDLDVKMKKRDADLEALENP